MSKLSLLLFLFFGPISCTSLPIKDFPERNISSERVDPFSEVLESIHHSNGVTDQHIRQAFYYYQNDWLSSFSPKRISKTLKAIIKSGGTSPNKSTINFFKDDRKNANLLRIFFYIFNSEHQAPKKFNKFVKVYGALNDSIASKNKKKNIKNAKNMLSILQKTDLKNAVGDNFRPVNLRQVENFLMTTMDKIKEGYKIYQQGNLDQHQLHQVRKNFKIFLQLYNFYSVYEGGGQDKDFIKKRDRMDKFVTELGDIHDDFIDAQLRKSSSRDIHQVSLSKKLKRDFASLIDDISPDFSKTTCQSTIEKILLSK